MRQVSYVIAAAALAVAVGGCADPYAPRYSYSQSYAYPSSYTVYRTTPSVTYTTVYPSGYAYTSYRSYDYDRYYMGIHPGPELHRAAP